MRKQTRKARKKQSNAANCKQPVPSRGEVGRGQPLNAQNRSDGRQGDNQSLPFVRKQSDPTLHSPAATPRTAVDYLNAGFAQQLRLPLLENGLAMPVVGGDSEGEVSSSSASAPVVDPPGGGLGQAIPQGHTVEADTPAHRMFFPSQSTYFEMLGKQLVGKEIVMHLQDSVGHLASEQMSLDVQIVRVRNDLEQMKLHLDELIHMREMRKLELKKTKLLLANIHSLVPDTGMRVGTQEQNLEDRPNSEGAREGGKGKARTTCNGVKVARISSDETGHFQELGVVLSRKDRHSVANGDKHRSPACAKGPLSPKNKRCGTTPKWNMPTLNVDWAPEWSVKDSACAVCKTGSIQPVRIEHGDVERETKTSPPTAQAQIENARADGAETSRLRGSTTVQLAASPSQDTNQSPRVPSVARSSICTCRPLNYASLSSPGRLAMRLLLRPGSRSDFQWSGPRASVWDVAKAGMVCHESLSQRKQTLSDTKAGLLPSIGSANISMFKRPSGEGRDIASVTQKPGQLGYGYGKDVRQPLGQAFVEVSTMPEPAAPNDKVGPLSALAPSGGSKTGKQRASDQLRRSSPAPSRSQSIAPKPLLPVGALKGVYMGNFERRDAIVHSPSAERVPTDGEATVLLPETGSNTLSFSKSPAAKKPSSSLVGLSVDRPACSRAAKPSLDVMPDMVVKLKIPSNGAAKTPSGSVVLGKRSPSSGRLRGPRKKMPRHLVSRQVS